MKGFSVLALNILAAAVISSTVRADDGALRFKGNLTTASCMINNGESGAGNNILVHMGSFRFADLRPAKPGVGWVNSPSRLVSIVIECTEADDFSGVALQLDAQAGGTGMDPDDKRLLALAPGGAKGAAIALLDLSGYIIDLSNAPKISKTFQAVSPDTGDPIVMLRFSVAYAKTTGPEVYGVANASLPFVVTYE